VHVSLLGIGFYDALYPSEERGALYIHALRHHKSAFREVFRALADEREGAVLFHCTSGKDRTGLVAAILLSLAGVPREEIVHNYAISAQYLNPVPLVREPENAARESPPGAIEAFLRVLEDQYGGAYSYLRTIGVSETEVDALMARLGQ
jgi:protein-tyrosine phosphatase